MAASAPPLVRRAVVSLSVGQRGTHGLDLRTPQRLEDCRTAGHQGTSKRAPQDGRTAALYFRILLRENGTRQVDLARI
jgi:hypothetical protein